MERMNTNKGRFCKQHIIDTRFQKQNNCSKYRRTSDRNHDVATTTLKYRAYVALTLPRRTFHRHGVSGPDPLVSRGPKPVARTSTWTPGPAVVRTKAAAEIMVRWTRRMVGRRRVRAGMPPAKRRSGRHA